MVALCESYFVKFLSNFTIMANTAKMWELGNLLQELIIIVIDQLSTWTLTLQWWYQDILILGVGGWSFQEAGWGPLHVLVTGSLTLAVIL